MVKQIIKDELFLSNKSTLMTKDDLFIKFLARLFSLEIRFSQKTSIKK